MTIPKYKTLPELIDSYNRAAAREQHLLASSIALEIGNRWTLMARAHASLVPQLNTVVATDNTKGMLQ